MSQIHGHPSRRSGEVMNGVCAYAEQTGATILAEGIERESHLIAAQSLGATLAQGWYFGRPAPALELRPVTGRQDARHVTPATACRYAELARRAAFTAALGIGLGPEPTPGVRGIALDAGDVLVGEWDIAVLGPHYAGALVARDLGDEGPDRERCFEFVLTFERTLVADIAAALISRLS